MDESAFRARAQELLHFRRSGGISRPFFVEFTGTPDSGKSTIIKELDVFFRQNDFRVWCPQEGAEAIRHVSRTTPLYNIRTGIYALSVLIDKAETGEFDLVLFDRCIFDAYCWMHYWHRKGLLSDGEKEYVGDFFISSRFVRLLDAACIIVCDVDTAILRSQRLSLEQDERKTTNSKTIHLLREVFRQSFNQVIGMFAAHGTGLIWLDTEQMTEIGMVRDAAELLINMLSGKYICTGVK